MSLPNAVAAFVEAKKISEYLLNQLHPEGVSKEKFFSGFGFSLASVEQMANALVVQGRDNQVVEVRESAYGKLYRVQCSCPTPDQRNPCINTVWQLDDPNDKPRLVTAYPKKA